MQTAEEIERKSEDEPRLSYRDARFATVEGRQKMGKLLV